VRAALVISERDNVATALEALETGQRLDLAGTTLMVQSPVPRGHKIALRPIRSGEAVIKYGSPIGTAIADIPQGTHVHTHNVASDRGRGDRVPRADAREEPRIAEPPDEATPPPQGNRR